MQGMRNCTKLQSVQNVHVIQPSYGKVCLDFPVRVRLQPSLSDHIEKDRGCSWNLSHSLISIKYKSFHPKYVWDDSWQDCKAWGSSNMSQNTQSLEVTQPKEFRNAKSWKTRRKRKAHDPSTQSQAAKSCQTSDIIRLRRHRTSSDIDIDKTFVAISRTSTLPGPREHMIVHFCLTWGFSRNTLEINTPLNSDYHCLSKSIS